MSLNESTVEDADLEWLGKLGDTIGHGLHIAPGERASFGEMVLAGQLRACDLAVECGWQDHFFAVLPNCKLSVAGRGFAR